MPSDNETLELALGFRATHAHVVAALGEKRFAKMLKKMMPQIQIVAAASKTPKSTAAFKLAQNPEIAQEERAAWIAAAVELKLAEGAEKN